jgi:hypothetical protein
MLTLREMLEGADQQQRARIAKATGMSTTSLANRDAEHLAVWIKRAIATALGKPVSDLFGGDR